MPAQLVPWPWNHSVPYSKSGKGQFCGLGYYRTKFTVASEKQGKKVFLYFYSVQSDCITWLNGKKIGTFGQMSAFAFYPNKQITTGEGGIILTDDDSLADICFSLRDQGRSKQGGWLNHERLGYNFRLSDINCALGIAQLSRIEQIKAKRKQVAKWYQEMLR